MCETVISDSVAVNDSFRVPYPKRKKRNLYRITLLSVFLYVCPYIKTNKSNLNILLSYPTNIINVTMGDVSEDSRLFHFHTKTTDWIHMKISCNIAYT